MQTVELTKQQIIKGVVLLVVYMIAKTVVSQVYGLYRGFGEDLTWETGAVLGGMIIGGTFSLLYVGIRIWMGVPLSTWITRKSQVLGDILWGVFFSAVIVGVNMVVYALFISFQLIPASPAEQVLSATSFGLTVLFRVLVTAPCEEVLFRGFVQHASAQWFGAFPAVVAQAVLYAVLYLGYYPLEIWFFIVIPFIHGLIWGLIRLRRGTCLPSFISHAAAG
jgi:membrane protease YdiL (CAAX protease family)